MTTLYFSKFLPMHTLLTLHVDHLKRHRIDVFKIETNTYTFGVLRQHRDALRFQAFCPDSHTNR